MKGDHSPVQFGANFYILLLVTLMAAVAGRLGTSLSMQALSFSPEDVASTATMSGLFTVPVFLLIGALTNRWGQGPPIVGLLVNGRWPVNLERLGRIMAFLASVYAVDDRFWRQSIRRLGLRRPKSVAKSA